MRKNIFFNLCLVLISVVTLACSQKEDGSVNSHWEPSVPRPLPPVVESHPPSTSENPQTTSEPDTEEQSSFGVEDELERPVKTPKDVLAVLRKDQDVKDCLQSAQENGEEPSDLSTWFAASKIDLNNDRQPDLVIKPDYWCLHGASAGPFWVFHHTEQGYVLVLKAGGMGLHILKTQTKGFRNIETSSVVGSENVSTQTYQFDGRQYKLTSSKTEPIDPE